jgi:hypothetical protein
MTQDSLGDGRGRPSKYKPEFCELVIEYGKAGKSAAWMAAELGVDKDSLYEWAKVHPEFSDAFTRARLESQRWWEDKGQSGMEAPGFNASIWSRSMAARFPEDWREKAAVEMTGANGGPIEHTHTVSASTGRLLESLSGIGANRQPAPPVPD